MTTNPFTFHTNLEYTKLPSGQFQGDCPLCGKEKHFHFNDDWQWDCKVCSPDGGNIYTFLSLLHQRMFVDPVSILAEERGIPLPYFLNRGFRFNQYCSNERYHVFAVPTYNSDGNLNQLYKVAPYFDDKKKKWRRRFMPTVTLPLTLFNWPQTILQNVWLVEGFFDTVAADAIVGPSRSITVIGWPGSGFKEQWCKAFAGKDLFIHPDNDDAGKREFVNIVTKISASRYKPRVLHHISWPEDTPPGFDINDVLRIQGPNAYQFITDNHTELVSSPTQQLAKSPPPPGDESCDSFEKLVADCSSAYYFTHDMYLLLLGLTTSVYSLLFEGEQIWFRVMGPPGSSKTTIAEIVGASNNVVMRDTFTGLLSGYKDPAQPDKDASMIPLITDKGLFVKDADALMKQGNFPQIIAELRAFYDKKLAVTFRNFVDHEYEDIRCVFGFFGTHDLRGMDDTALGERFIDFELHVTQADRDAITLRAIANAEREISQERNFSNLHARARGFIDSHLMKRRIYAPLTDKERQIIHYSGSIISYLRANVKRDRRGKIKYKPHPEVPSRVTKQLTKIYNCAPGVFNTQHIPPHVHELIKHVTRDIIDINSLRYRLTNLMLFSPGLTSDKIVEMMAPLPPDLVLTEVENMFELNMLQVIPISTGSGYRLNSFFLQPHIATQFKTIAE